MKTTAPLTKVQYGIYAECIAHQGEPCYNLPYLYVLDGSLDEEKLKKAVESAVAAHPTLFTRITLNGQGDPQQSVDDSYTCNVLHRLGFHWLDTSWDYVERMLKAIGGFGFFDER